MPIDLVCALRPASLVDSLKDRLQQCVIMTAGGDGEQVTDTIRTRIPDLIVVSPALAPEPIEDWIRQVRDLPENPDVVLIVDRENPVFRAAMLRAGCLAVLHAGLPVEDLAQTLQVLVRRRMNHVHLAVKARAPLGPCHLDDFVPRSPKMRELMELARQVVEVDTSLLVLGETGTGKERLARAIHEEGPRASGPFVAVNCGALPETLLESELFGHEKGAFTGASRDRKGYFEQADGGTLFLDEIAEIPIHLQVKLLRAIEHRKVQRVGGERSLSLDVRLMAATNRDLESEVKQGRFRRDLYYRLAVVTLSLPPLRERREDIPDLLDSYLEHFRLALKKPIYGIQDEAARALVLYDWPGNVRELINVVERAVLLAPGPELRPADLPRAVSKVESAPDGALSEPGGRNAPSQWLEKPLRAARRECIDDFEHTYVTNLLRATGGRIGASARRAGINERSLYDLMRRHGLKKEAYKR